MAFIKHISTYLPSDKVSNEDISEQFPEWDSQKILDKIGIEERHVTSVDEFVSDMAVKAVNLLLTEHSIKKSDIDFLIVCTQTPDYFLPTTACLVQDRTGLPTTVGAIDINQGCSGYIYGLSLAKGLIASGTANNVILVTAETYSKHIHKNDKGNLSLFGDAATATLVSVDGELEILKFSLGSDGSGAENLIVKNGGGRFKMTNDENDLGNYLFMDGSKIFDFTSKAVPALVEKNLKINAFVKEEIDTFIFHQANTYMLNFLKKRLKISDDSFVIDMLNYGNTVSSTIPIALKNATSIREMNKIMLVGFGVGYSWGAVCLKKYQ